MTSSKGRGTSWRHKEILDLLDIWGEEKVQEQLKNNHRNIDSFQTISKKMQDRGHHRTALECRSKTKSMRYEYRKIVNHNAKSGNSTATCPFYDELHSILRGDATIRPKRICSSLQITRKTWNKNSQPELFSDSSESSISEQRQTSCRKPYSTDNEKIQSNPCDSNSDCDITTMQDSYPLTETNDTESNYSTELWYDGELSQENESNTPSTDESCKEPPTGIIQNIKATLSPASRMALIRNRKSQRAGNALADKIMKHCSAENSKIISVMSADSEIFKNFMEHSKKEDEIMRKDRHCLLKCIQKTTSVLQLIASKMPNNNSHDITNQHVDVHAIDSWEPTLSSSDDNDDGEIDDDGEISMASEEQQQTTCNTPVRNSDSTTRPKRHLRKPLIFSP